MEESSHQHCSFEQYTEADVPLPGILLRTVQSVPRMPRRVPSSVLGVGSRTTKCKDLTVSVCHPWDSLVLPEGWRAELNSPAQHCAPALPQRHPWDAFLPPPSPLRPSKSPTRAHHPRKRNPPSQAGVAADQVAPAMHQFSQRAARCAQRRQIRWLICLRLLSPLKLLCSPPSQAGVAAAQVAPAVHQVSQRAARCAQRRQTRWLICLRLLSPLKLLCSPPSQAGEAAAQVAPAVHQFSGGKVVVFMGDFQQLLPVAGVAAAQGAPAVHQFSQRAASCALRAARCEQQRQLRDC